MAAGKRAETEGAPDQDATGRKKTTPTDRSWKIVAACAALLTIYLWLHADALRLLLSGFASR